ncbi:hypothetical protein K7X08_026990 [Anisodus acutangulus]|uniref:Uncharacterized protein n=1 Tax=Anisodus acutangulus TaxID=402998 RepID=A0A9Q1L9Z4_9SOLA|nr:hypothetical protein K7X08_026990 [Anisodus acutangulus]
MICFPCQNLPKQALPPAPAPGCSKLPNQIKILRLPDLPLGMELNQSGLHLHLFHLRDWWPISCLMWLWGTNQETYVAFLQVLCIGLT